MDIATNGSLLRNTSRSCDCEVAQEDKAFDVVDEIGHSDLDRCSGDPDSPMRQNETQLLGCDHGHHRDQLFFGRPMRLGLHLGGTHRRHQRKIWRSRAHRAPLLLGIR